MIENNAFSIECLPMVWMSRFCGEEKSRQVWLFDLKTWKITTGWLLSFHDYRGPQKPAARHSGFCSMACPWDN
jgi:hypothetical protein